MALLQSLLGHLGPRSRKLVRYVGFVVLALVSFVFAFQLTFPFDRVKDKVVELLSEKYEVTIGSVDRGLVPGRMYFKAVSLRTRPTKVDEVATTFTSTGSASTSASRAAARRGVDQARRQDRAGPHQRARSSPPRAPRLSHRRRLPSASLPMRGALRCR
jgi:hypothetical protein